MRSLVLDLVLPPRCVGCGRVGVWLCEWCTQQLALSDRPICPRCGDGWMGEGLCPRCKVAPLHLAPVRSAFLFEGVVRDAIHALKYQGAQSVAPLLAPYMAEAWHRFAFATDVLMPVPLYWERERMRGYNQSVLLGRALAAEIDHPLVENVLLRIRPTQAQVGLKREARWRNVQGAFMCYDECDLTGLHITLVDDVVTTGATLEACAVALLSRGAKEVNAITLAHAV